MRPAALAIVITLALAACSQSPQWSACDPDAGAAACPAGFGCYGPGGRAYCTAFCIDRGFDDAGRPLPAEDCERVFGEHGRDSVARCDYPLEVPCDEEHDPGCTCCWASSAGGYCRSSTVDYPCAAVEDCTAHGFDPRHGARCIDGQCGVARFCVRSICRLLSCNDDSDCAGARCMSGTCRP